MNIIKGENISEDFIFALDIGTRSVIGIVGVQQDDLFKVIACEVMEYKNRAVVDGQIEDIGETAKIALKVKDNLENRLGVSLKDVYIAAAGRVLRTAEAQATLDIPQNESISQAFISHLETEAIKSAYTTVSEQNENTSFYCVGHAVKKYILDGYELSNLIDHKGSSATVSLIATFLPREVVESLYTTMKRIGLTVAGLTLEPIAAMNAVIPTELRKLNLALCDIGAGTSDIAVCSDGSVLAYTMATMAGDEITEAIMNNCLVDFATAEEVKKTFSCNPEQNIVYNDILGFEHDETPQEFMEKIMPSIEALSHMICEKILSANGHAPAAVFLVGGGSQTPELCRLVAEELKMDNKRVAAGSNTYIKKAVISDENVFSAEFATPIGIALTAISKKNSDTFTITVNGEKAHLLNAWDTSILGILQMIGYQYSQIMGHSGKSLSFELNGSTKTIRGGFPEPAQILLNGKPAGLSELVTPGDCIDFEPAICGKDATAYIYDIIDGKPFPVTINGTQVMAGHLAEINGEPVTENKILDSSDKLTINIVDTLGKLLNLYEVEYTNIFVNSEEKNITYTLKENDIIEVNVNQSNNPSSSVQKDDIKINTEIKNISNNSTSSKNINIFLNGKSINIKSENGSPYIQFFQLLDYAGIKPEDANGRKLVERLNGSVPSYLDIVKNGDRADIYWE